MLGTNNGVSKQNRMIELILLKWIGSPFSLICLIGSPIQVYVSLKNWKMYLLFY